MSKHIRGIALDGYWWHYVVIKGKGYIIGRIGRIGDCIRP